jgi:hypothetical protein
VAIKRLVLFSSIWSACAISISFLARVAGNWFSLTLTMGYAIFGLTFVVLATGVFFLFRLTKIVLSLYRPSKATETRKA